jgi:prepilin-type N-terminal cleavage/methylation domain-containing protein
MVVVVFLLCFILKKRKSIFMNKKKSSNYLGFTLIELMLVIVIITVLTSFILLVIDTTRKKTKDAIITSSLEQIQSIAETTYNPNDGYMKIAEMRGNAADIDDDHPTVREVRQKIRDMGSYFRLYFPEDGVGDSGYGEYCTYALLATDPEKVICIDSRGEKRKANLLDINCESLARPANCDDR